MNVCKCAEIGEFPWVIWMYTTAVSQSEAFNVHDIWFIMFLFQASSDKIK